MNKPPPVPHCQISGVHLVPLQAMEDQIMQSTGQCQYCGKWITASVKGDIEVRDRPWRRPGHH